MNKQGDKDKMTTCIVGFLAGSIAWLCHCPAMVMHGMTADPCSKIR